MEEEIDTHQKHIKTLYKKKTWLEYLRKVSTNCHISSCSYCAAWETTLRVLQENGRKNRLGRWAVCIIWFWICCFHECLWHVERNRLYSSVSLWIVHRCLVVFLWALWPCVVLFLHVLCTVMYFYSCVYRACLCRFVRVYKAHHCVGLFLCV